MPNFFARRVSMMGAAAALLVAVACQKQTETPSTINDLTALPLTAPAPVDNLSSPAKIALGRALFWDPVLSGARDVSCASCHHPATAYADGLDLTIGTNGQGLGTARHFRAPNDIAFGQRNSPTLLNAAFNSLAADGSCDPTHAPMFWDSRAASLETQSVLPLSTLEEMRGHQYAADAALDSVVARLRAIPAYGPLFAAAFGGSAPITADNLGRAIACFERTLVATDAPFDKYMRGDNSALTAQQVQGLNAFVTSGCAKCHSGPMLSDYKTHVLGVADNAKNVTSDTGLNGTYAFRTPSLRNVARTAPYMHSGTLGSLQAVLTFYDPGPNNRTTANSHVAVSQRDPLFPTRVTNQQAIIAFLNSLTASSYDQTVPTQVPSGLPVGGNIQ